MGVVPTDAMGLGPGYFARAKFRDDNQSVAARGVPRPKVALSWETRTEMEDWGEPKSTVCWAAV